MSDITKPDQSLLLEFEAPEVDRDQFPVSAQTGLEDYVDYVYDGQWNLFLTAISKWSKYLDKYHSVEFWVKSTGSDSNTGTDASPFLTIDHAIAQVAEGGNAKIHIEKNVVLTENITIKGGLITIIPDASETFTFGTHSGAGVDDDTIYHLILEGDASFVSFAEVIVQATDYDTYQSCIYQAGYGVVQLLGGITFDDNSGVTNPPSLVTAGVTVNSMGKINLFTASTITTNSSGYIVGEVGASFGGSITDLNEGATIDDPDFWWENYNTYQYETGMAYDGSVTTFVFGENAWDTGAGTFGADSFTIDISNSVQDFFDAVYGSGNYTVTGSGSSNYIIEAVGANSPRPIQWKHENTGTSTTTYGTTLPEKLDKNITRNF